MGRPKYSGGSEIHIFSKCGDVDWINYVQNGVRC
jgi:hypothetical protein